jgi:YidC/Oxa1 family membrane protein insertase
MWVLRKTTNDEKLLAILEAKREENKKNPNKKMSGLAARLQAMQQQQQELQRKRDELARKNARLRGE